MSTGSKISVVAEGKVTSKNGAKSVKLQNGLLTIHYGWFMQVRNEDDKYETSLPVKTVDESVSLQLAAAAANDKTIVVSGNLRNEPYAKNPDGTVKTWVQNLYVNDVQVVG